MKKIILIFALIAMSLSFTDCNKSNKLSANQPDIYCIWITHGSAPKTFYGCAETKSEMQQELIKIRDSNQFSEVTTKATCSECQ